MSTVVETSEIELSSNQTNVTPALSKYSSIDNLIEYMGDDKIDIVHGDDQSNIIRPTTISDIDSSANNPLNSTDFSPMPVYLLALISCSNFLYFRYPVVHGLVH